MLGCNLVGCFFGLNFTSKEIETQPRKKKPPKFASKGLYRPSLNSYDCFMFFHKLEIQVFGKPKPSINEKLINVKD